MLITRCYSVPFPNIVPSSPELIPLHDTMQTPISQDYPRPEESEALLQGTTHRITHRTAPRAFLPRFNRWKANPMWSVRSCPCKPMTLTYNHLLIGYYPSSYSHPCLYVIPWPLLCRDVERHTSVASQCLPVYKCTQL